MQPELNSVASRPKRSTTTPPRNEPEARPICSDEMNIALALSISSGADFSIHPCIAIGSAPKAKPQSKIKIAAGASRRPIRGRRMIAPPRRKDVPVSVQRAFRCAAARPTKFPINPVMP
jgi:hypothetical protein